jgi:hypothetical protein
MRGVKTFWCWFLRPETHFIPAGRERKPRQPGGGQALFFPKFISPAVNPISQFGNDWRCVKFLYKEMM